MFTFRIGNDHRSGCCVDIEACHSFLRVYVSPRILDGMTERIYEAEPFLFDLDATIISRTRAGAGEEIVLDRTVFFATSGGQAHDTGQIAGVRIINVEKRGGEVVHVAEAPLPQELGPGSRVAGRIDAARRLDHMRQHHGQHLLSAALYKSARAETAAVHFGNETSTLDLNQLVNESQIAESVNLTNQVILEDREVRVHNISRDELHKFKLRREPGVEAETLRIIDVDGFDMTPCSGTHPRRTGQVGPVAVIGLDRIRGGSRLVFVCGERAIRDAAAKDTILRSLARELSTAPLSVGEAVSRLNNSERDARKKVKFLESLLSGLEAKQLVTDHPGEIVMIELDPERSEDSLQFLSNKIIELGRAAVIGLRSQSRASLVVAAPKGSRFDCLKALQAALPLIEGKGGGNVNFARGAGGKVVMLKEAMEKVVGEMGRVAD
ncbi:MAG: alanyl-tRNA editing protein [Planctomycetota bacterium]